MGRQRTSARGMAGRAERQPALLPFLLLALASAASLPGAAGDAPSTADVLLDFAAAARGAAADALPDWQPGSDPCAWRGVGCAGAAVTELRLPRAGLQGTLHPDLALLTSLRRIDLSGNQLSGRLPVRWARLGALERLHLDGNRLTGALPASWNMLEGMQHITLARNRLNGTLPVAWASLGNQLYVVDLSGNALAGPLPPAWGRQRMLLRLGLARNNLTGPLPREWGRLGRLLQLELGGNGLTGSLPAEWGALRQAASLDLAGNALAGPLPPAWGDMAGLQMLSLAGNQLSGAVPAQWAALADRAYRISLAGNPQLCGEVPAPLSGAVLTSGDSARGSQLGRPCSWQADAAALLQFKAGVLAASAAAAAAGGAGGAAAAALGTPLADWQEGSNPCSAEAWTGVSCRGGRVAILNLANAGLRVASLEHLAALGALQKLVLAGNAAAAASLPASWGALRQLAALDLSGTGVAGALPASWAGMAALKQLRLRSNALTGALPAEWGALEGLAELDLSQNALTGGLPAQWATLGSLASLDASANYLAGPLPEAWRELGSLRELRLASNHLSGPIPASWARLPSLTRLHLDSNVGVCGAAPAWRAGTQVSTEATSLGQSCILVGTSGALAGAVMGVGLSVTLASLCAVAAMAVYVRRQRVQLAVLQRERSAASFSEFMSGGSFGGGGKLAGVQHSTHSLHVFAGSKAAAGGQAAGVLPLAIPAYLGPDEHGAYIQVPVATPGSALPAGSARTPPRSASATPAGEHRSPSPGSGMPSPDRHQWQVATQAAGRGVDLTARAGRPRQKRLFRSRSEAPASLAEAAQQQQRGASGVAAEEAAAAADLEMLRVHSRLALLGPQQSDGNGMV